MICLHLGGICKSKNCKGKLKDTIVNFGDDLHARVCGGLDKAIETCSTADVCICLGSSFTVYPACELPLKSKNIVIVNLQETDLDDKASVRLWTTCDTFFEILMKILEEKLSQQKGNAGDVPLKRRKL